MAYRIAAEKDDINDQDCVIASIPMHRTDGSPIGSEVQTFSK